MQGLFTATDNSKLVLKASRLLEAEAKAALPVIYGIITWAEPLGPCQGGQVFHNSH